MSPHPSNPVDASDGTAAEFSFLGETIHDLELGCLGRRDLELWRRERNWEFGKQFAGRLRLGTRNLQQAGRAVERVVEPVPALAEADVAGKLTGQQCSGFLQLRFHVRVSGLPHDRPPAVLADQCVEVARALHVEDDVGTWIAPDDVAGEQHQ